MAVFAFLGGLELWEGKFYWRKPNERFLILGLTIFLFIAIHILSVRSAILTMYLCLFFKLLELIFNQKRWRVGLLSLLILTTIPYFAYETIPSLRHRIDYAIWDFGQYKQGDLTQKSDSERITSLKMGIAAFNQNPIFGVGYGDIMDEVGNQYRTYFPKLEVREPHSFWLFSLVGTGIIGTLFFLMAFVTHWFYEKRYRIVLFSLLHFLILFTNTIDFVVEGTYGAVFYAFFVALFLSQNKKNR
jgi:O-antigen ligase